MGIELSPEQLSLRDTLRDFFANSLSKSQLRSYVNAHDAGSAAPESLRLSLCASFAQFEFASFFGSSAEDSTSSGFAALAILAKECGRAACPEPFYEALFSSNYLSARHCSADDKDLLQRLGVASASNSSPLMLCASLIENFAEDAKRRQYQLQESEGKFLLSGEFLQVDALPQAQGYLLPLQVNSSAKAATKRRNAQLFFLPAAQAEAILSPSLDLTRGVLSLRCKSAQIYPFSMPLAIVLHEARILKAAELAGIAAFLVELTCDYLKSREQFGKPIGSFQALQHAMADMLLASEALDAMVDFAVWTAEESPRQLPLAALSAISFACEHVPSLCEKALQLHGGLGFTWEYDLHLYLRRAKKAQLLFAPSESSERELLALARRAG